MSDNVPQVHLHSIFLLQTLCCANRVPPGENYTEGRASSHCPHSSDLLVIGLHFVLAYTVLIAPTSIVSGPILLILVGLSKSG